jgi:hypothetical protein
MHIKDPSCIIANLPTATFRLPDLGKHVQIVSMVQYSCITDRALCTHGGSFPSPCELWGKVALREVGGEKRERSGGKVASRRLVTRGNSMMSLLILNFNDFLASPYSPPNESMIFEGTVLHPDNKGSGNEKMDRRRRRSWYRGENDWLEDEIEEVAFFSDYDCTFCVS